MRSQRSTFLRCSGATGLFITQGSIRISLPFALRTFHVPWPTQVKLTSALSAMLASPQFRCRAEKPIFPHGQREHADRGDGPQVGEEELARLAIEPEKTQSEQHERDDSTALDAAHGEQQRE